MTLNIDKTPVMAHILRVARDGVGKIMQQLPSLSHSQIRRISTELVDKGLLRYIEPILQQTKESFILKVSIITVDLS